MNTNKLKRFAQDARRKLLDQVASRMELILNSDSAELREKAAALSNLKEEINRSSNKQVIDKVAYTWFNRLMALRFMDANDYQPIGVRVVSPKDGFTLPEILEDARQGQIPDELPVKRQHIYDLLDGRIPSSNMQNEVYKELLIGACNHLHNIFPFLFEKINDYTELLLPDDLTSEFSIVHDFIEGMQKEDCEEVEVIGWLYQFYISERKDEVFASKSKVKKEDIPAATQLFTPRWIVEYMVQNTVGKLWLQNNPKSGLIEHMPYYVDSPSVSAEEFLKVDSVEEITLLDQACGSGHILVYGFELFSKIYEEQGYNAGEIPQLILEKNLFGSEIDERAAQLASMALMMKARAYQRRIFKKQISLNVLCFKDVVFNDEELKQILNKISLDASEDFLNDLKLLENATNFGSLILPRSTSEFLQNAFVQIENKLNNADVFEQNLLERLRIAVHQLLLLNRKFHCVVDNPPYMGKNKMNKELAQWTKINYPKERADMMVCFMKRGIIQLKENGFFGMINLPSWMFLSSFEAYRLELITNFNIDTLLQLGRGVFGSDFGSVAFTIMNTKIPYPGVYRRLFENHVDVRSNAKIEKLFFDKSYNYYKINKEVFLRIPGNPIAYWVHENLIQSFSSQLLKDISSPMQGMATTNNTLFLKYWSEVNYESLGLGLTLDEAITSNKTWFPYNKGGEFKKWYGNHEYVVQYKNNGSLLKSTVKEKYRHKSYAQGFSDEKWDKLIEVWVLKNQHSYFKKSLSWSKVTAGSFSIRYYPQGFIFDVSGCSIFLDDDIDIFYLNGLLNSKVTKYILDIFSPTLNYEVEHIKKIPVLRNADAVSEISVLAEKNIEYTKKDFESRETSWGFKSHEIINHNNTDIRESFDDYKRLWEQMFFDLHKNEEEINRQFINLYGLEDILSPDIPLENITILREETFIEKGELIFKLDEIFRQFMSFAVGCVFGRYSLDKEGLVLANQGETLNEYLAKIQESNSKFQSLEDLTFVPDEDNIIPVLDDEYFEDDIVNRFYEFLKASFGDENFDKNLAFVEECLGKDVRKYFVKDFYKDHIKRYKKRPIFWMFSSPKGSFNVLIYMHRYTPNTLNQILNGYLLEYREKLKSRIEHLDHIIETGSSTEQTKAGKEKDKLKIVLLELQEYEREILYPLATERIAIDLDDGVLVNYNKFGKAIQEVPGLNDKKTKKKVQEFDWIDTEVII